MKRDYHHQNCSILVALWVLTLPTPFCHGADICVGGTVLFCAEKLLPQD